MPPAPHLRHTSTAGPRSQSVNVRATTKVKPAPKEAREFQARRGDVRAWDTSAWETWLHYGGLA
ncbi:hypothetical protein [Streptomyces sp. NPDC039016]|uniref:hypothetical protein n=1 Tax=unclassified Streptomyces TaxID=2593676 RepID=UPI0026CB10F0